jgi:hypothetical protein
LRVLRVTVDTNVLVRDMDAIGRARNGLAVEIAQTTVTLREQKQPLSGPSAIPETGIYGESRYDSGAIYAAAHVFETVVIGESLVGMALIGASSRFERVEKYRGERGDPVSPCVFSKRRAD